MENKKKTVLKLMPSCIFLAIIAGIFLKFYDASQREAKAEYLCSRITRALSLPCVYGDKPEDILLYKEYLAANYLGRESAYVFSYFDCDRDGKLELLIKQKDSEKIGSDIMKYEGNGLRDIYSSEFKNLSVKDLKWFEIARNEQIKADNPGIDVVIEEEGNWNWTRMWYSEEEDFLTDFGFSGQPPFYVYTNEDAKLRMSLYYNKEAEKGCGILSVRSRTDYGFVFSKIEEGEWEGEKDYYKLESVYGDTGEESIDGNYRENYEYDAQGRLIHCKSVGLVEWFSGEPEEWTVLALDYEYDEMGKLRQRSYYHNPNIFGTWHTTGVSYFDTLGRVEYEYNYITHGRQYYYYIYSGNEAKPDYCLMVDPGWGAELVKYK